MVVRIGCPPVRLSLKCGRGAALCISSARIHIKDVVTRFAATSLVP